MSAIRTLLTDVVAESFRAAGLNPELGVVIVSDRPDLAQYQCNGALAGAKALKKNPREVATQLVSLIPAAWDRHPLVQSFHPDALKGVLTLSLAGPGFINFVLSDAFLAAFLDQSRLDPRLGVDRSIKARKVVIDFGAPNVAKAMHAGHLRSTIIGDSLSRLLRFLGDEVVGDNHIGDWGTPMGMVICELKREQPTLPYFDEKSSGPYPKDAPVTMEDLERLYPQGSKRFKEDPDFHAQVLRATDELQKGRPGYKALWQHFVDTTYREMNREYDSLGIHFDVWLGESFYHDKMPPMVERIKATGHAVMSDGALVIPLADEANPETPPLLLVKSGGGFLYHTSDLATVEYRVNELKADLALYVVDKRQSFHFKQVFAAAKKVGLAGNHTEFVHAGFGTMNGSDGKPFKTREGGVIKLKDLITMVVTEAQNKLQAMGVDQTLPAPEVAEIAHQVGIATLKYADLKNHRLSDYIFDLERFSQFEGNTGPYLLYAAVRIQSILSKAEAQGFRPGSLVAARSGAEGAAERQLILELLRLPDALSRAYDLFEPHHLCEFGFTLSQAFNFFYKECHILREEDPARRDSWLSLAKLTRDQLVLCLSLLGIEVPKRM